MEWIRSSIGFITLLVAAAIVVSLQYRKRRTFRNRWVALSILICGVLGYVSMSLPLAFAIQQHFSTQPVDTSALSFTLVSGQQQFALAMSKEKRIPHLHAHGHSWPVAPVLKPFPNFSGKRTPCKGGQSGCESEAGNFQHPKGI